MKKLVFILTLAMSSLAFANCDPGSFCFILQTNSAKPITIDGEHFFHADDMGYGIPFQATIKQNTPYHYSIKLRKLALYTGKNAALTLQVFKLNGRQAKEYCHLTAYVKHTTPGVTEILTIDKAADGSFTCMSSGIGPS